MHFLFGLGVAAVAIGAAVRMARARGVPPWHMLAGSLLVAVAANVVTVGGSLAAFKWCANKTAQLLLILGSVAVGIAVGTWIAQIVWRRLQRPAARGEHGTSV